MCRSSQEAGNSVAPQALQHSRRRPDEAWHSAQRTSQMRLPKRSARQARRAPHAPAASGAGAPSTRERGRQVAAGRQTPVHVTRLSSWPAIVTATCVGRASTGSNGRSEPSSFACAAVAARPVGLHAHATPSLLRRSAAYVTERNDSPRCATVNTLSVLETGAGRARRLSLLCVPRSGPVLILS
jgi:hypothetical protein